MDANRAFQMIEKAFAGKQPVMVTDWTVTRRAISCGLTDKKLFLHAETGEWIEIGLSFCGLTLNGWTVEETAEGLLIAPETNNENGGSDDE